MRMQPHFTDSSPTLVLASASPSRLDILRRAGLDPIVEVSGVDESAIDEPDAADLATALAIAKATAVATRMAERGHDDVVIVGCDSVFECQGQVFGKPLTADAARARWQLMRGRSGVLHTGHHGVRLRHGSMLRATRTGSTVVHFADVTDDDIDAYVATGEPLPVAGGFTLEGRAGAFITGVEGDPHNVVGLSLPLLRELFADLAIWWPSLWVRNNT